MFKNLKPARVNPPGNLIRRELEIRGWSQRDLAIIMGRPVQIINELINGSYPITIDTAMQLSEAFEGIDADIWLNLETKYRLYLSQSSQKKTNVSLMRQLYEKLPVLELQKRGWLSATKDVDELKHQVLLFLGIKSLQDSFTVPVKMRHGFKTPDEISMFAWSKRVEQLASQQKAAKFSPNKFEEMISKLLDCSFYAKGIQNIRKVLLSYGIRFIITPHLQKTYLDGAAFYLNNDVSKPVVAITLRYNRIDWFWFTLLHELAHIFKGHCEKVGIMDGEKVDEIDQRVEDEADELAKDWLIPTNIFHDFVKTRFIKYSDVTDLSVSIKRHPGIIVGRLQREGTIPYSRYRKSLVKVKDLLGDIIEKS